MKNAYLIVGDSNRLIDSEIKKIVMMDENIVHISNDDNCINNLLNEANYFSLDNTKKIVIIKNCSIFTNKSDEENKVIKYLENPNPASTIIFINNKIDSRKKIVKIIKEKYELIELPKIDYKNIYTIINNYLAKEKFLIDYNATRYIVNMWGLNVDIIFNELDKLMLYYNKPCTIKYEDTLQILSKPLDNNNFHFVDACINKKIADIRNIYHDLKINKTDELGLIIILAREYRLIYYVKKMVQNHKSINEIMAYLNLQEWQVKKLFDESQNFSEKELLNNIKLLAKIDEQIKKGLINKDICLYNFILNIIS